MVVLPDPALGFPNYISMPTSPATATAVSYAVGSEGEASGRAEVREGGRGSKQPGCAAARAFRGNRQRERSRRARADQQTVETQRPAGSAIDGGKFPIAGAGGVLRAGRKRVVCNRPTIARLLRGLDFARVAQPAGSSGRSLGDCSAML